MLVSLVYLETIKTLYTYLAIVSVAHLGFHKMITKAEGVAGEELHLLPLYLHFFYFFKSSHLIIGDAN
jgi:hypothetical protein